MMGKYSLYVWPAFIISLTILSLHWALLWIQFRTLSKTYKSYNENKSLETYKKEQKL